VTLENLVREVRRYQAGASSAAPALDRLPRALQSLQTPGAAAHLSWLQRLEHWLEGLLAPAASSSDLDLMQLLSHLSIPRLLQRLLLYLTVAAVLATAAWIVISELKAAGVLSRRSGERAPSPRTAGAAAATSAELRFEDLQRAPTSEASVWLLRLLVLALCRSGRLSKERTLTYRELTTQSLFDDPAQRARFARLAVLAEQQRYGCLSLSAEQWAVLLAEGRSLHDQWLAAPRGLAA
jgi:hypothetical protein